MLLLLGIAGEVGLTEDLIILHLELVGELPLSPTSGRWGCRRLQWLFTLNSGFPSLLGGLGLLGWIRTGQRCRIGYVFLGYGY
jgi:hypothetical protein